MMNYDIILASKDNVVLCGNIKEDKIAAMVNGKYYNCYDFRPLDGDGRQLREDNRALIKSMFEQARYKLTDIRQKEQDEREALEKKIREEAPKEAPRVNFADVLQDKLLGVLMGTATDQIIADILPAVREKVTTEFGVLPQVHKVVVPDRPAWETKEVLHKDFDKICSAVLDGESLYLCGPAGTGKSYLAKQVAQALNLPYYYANSITDDIQLKGFIDANGRYHETQFYEAFTKGGLFLLDELDASVPETLVMLNNALANGYFPFPNGKAEAHPDFHCLAAGNTFGTGADNEYTGRYQLDASSLDRFALVIVDYDREIETAMANGDESLVDFAEAFREATKKVSVSCLCTYRAIKRLAKFTAYMDKADAIRMALTKGLENDDVRLIAENISVSNEWTDALKAVYSK